MTQTCKCNAFVPGIEWLNNMVNTVSPCAWPESWCTLGLWMCKADDNGKWQLILTPYLITLLTLHLDQWHAAKSRPCMRCSAQRASCDCNRLQADEARNSTSPNVMTFCSSLIFFVLRDLFEHPPSGDLKLKHGIAVLT